jgi:malonyl-ACP decarboxylase
MENYRQSEFVITGIGITSAIGQGKEKFTPALLAGESAFGIMKRPGRQNGTSFIGSEIDGLHGTETFPRKLLNAASFSAQTALVTLKECWEDAKLAGEDPRRIGLVIGGSNIQQREISNIHESYRDRTAFLRPTYGVSFMDSDLCGICTEVFGIRGLAHTVGGASASGQMAVILAVQAVLSGQVDICIALGATMDLSHWELQALRSMGAMGSDKYAYEPQKACRPFDKGRDGFIYGESCGAIVIEKANTARQRNAAVYGKIAGWSVCMDGNRNPDPSFEGEKYVLEQAMKMADLSAGDIDYINPHGTGSLIGDETELKAICDCRLSHAYINATKSITGHGLSAAGTVEIIATLLQMQSGKLHPTRNLEDPIDNTFNWVRKYSITHQIKNALSLSMGFGGVNTAVCLQNG